MAIVPMKKIQVFALKSSQKKVFDYLQDLGAFEFSYNNDNDNSSYDVSPLRSLEKRLADFEFVIKFLTPYYQNSRGFSYALMGEKEVMDVKRVEEIAKQFNFQNIVDQAQDIEAEQVTLQNKLQESTRQCLFLEPFRAMEMNMEDIHSQTSVDFTFGRIKTPVFTLLEEDIEARTEDAELVKVSANAAETMFYVVSHKEATAIVREECARKEFQEVSFPKECTQVASYIKQQEEEQKNYEQRLSQLDEEAKRIAGELPKIKACYDFFSWSQESEEIASQAHYTDYTVMFEGWVRADTLKKAQLELAQRTENEALVEVVEAEEEAPVEIENNSVFKPFETVTRMYGLPRVHELDPTPLLAVFFLVFFGFCLTDALYGLLLAGMAFGALAFMRVPREMKGLITLVGIGGISTAILGAIFGGYAGIPVEVLPNFLQELQYFDTSKSEDIIKVMSLTFGLGFFQLWFGTVVAGVHTWKSGNKMEALSLHFSWTVFFALIGASQFLIENEVYAQYTIYGALVLICLGLAHDTKNPFMKLIAGPFAFIQQVIEWGSGILSYARLFALGLATGVIASVFNQIAMIIGGMLPAFAGIPLMIFIIAFGHILNIAINVLGAFIHSARLQFVEFFGKFLEAGGRKFNPFSKKSSYIYIDNK